MRSARAPPVQCNGLSLLGADVPLAACCSQCNLSAAFFEASGAIFIEFIDALRARYAFAIVG